MVAYIHRHKPTYFSATYATLDKEWEITNENNLKKRENRISECSSLFPLRFILISQEDMQSSFKSQINIIGHCRIMKIAGKEFELYFDQFIIDKVTQNCCPL